MILFVISAFGAARALGETQRSSSPCTNACQFTAATWKSLRREKVENEGGAKSATTRGVRAGSRQSQRAERGDARIAGESVFPFSHDPQEREVAASSL